MTHQLQIAYCLPMITKKKLAKLTFFRWLPLVCWIVVICYLSFSQLEGVNLPQFSAADKIAHLGMYGLLVYFLYIPLKTQLNAFTKGILLAVAFSAATELIQHFWINGRQGDPLDFLANVIGIFGMYLFIRNRIKT